MICHESGKKDPPWSCSNNIIHRFHKDCLRSLIRKALMWNIGIGGIKCPVCNITISPLLIKKASPTDWNLMENRMYEVWNSYIPYYRWKKKLINSP